MIFDEIANFEQYLSLNKDLKAGFDFIKNNNLETFKDGRYEIIKDKVFANVQTLTTKQKELKRWEVHRKYIDIQYIIKGSECMGYGLLKDFNDIEEKYDEIKDVEFLKGNKFNYINVEKGNFAIFFPNDVHAPMLSIEDDIEIKKVIVKVAV